jgi:hypothetical protein
MKSFGKSITFPLDPQNSCCALLETGVMLPEKTFSTKVIMLCNLNNCTNKSIDFAGALAIMSIKSFS